MKRPLLWIAPILAGFALTVPAPKARAADDTPPFGESIDVRVVNVEAVVTDRAGHRVTGLKPSDFRLRVDGKEVPIEYFNEINDGQALAPPAEAGTTAKPEAVPTVQGVAEGAVGTYYLVFIDDYFAVASKRDSVLKSIKGDLSRLGPNDRMAIVAYDGGRLAMLSSWSGSPADLAKAFDKAMERKPRGLDRLKEQRELVHDDTFASQATADGAPLDLNVLQTGLNDRQRVYGESLVRQLKGDVQAAVSTMRAFAAPQGRKVLLLLSGGWPFSVNTYISGGVGLPIKQIPDGEEIFRPLANTANLLGYTLYPVDLPGGTADPDAEGTAPSAIGSRTFPKDELDFSLGFLAKETGGEALYNGNRALAFATAKEDTRSFYWLGFSPSWQRNDKGHQIKLEARNADLRVRSRTGFLDLSRKAEVSMEVESALLFGNPPDALQMPMKVGTITRPGREETDIPLTLGLPVSLMTVVPVGGKFVAQLELRIAASDDAGNDSEIPVIPVTLTSAQPPVPGHFVKYDTKVKLRGNANHLVVAAYDPLSGKIATAETDLKKP
jgi:VWFA-related protein